MAGKAALPPSRVTPHVCDGLPVAVIKDVLVTDGLGHRARYE
jgi:hypothetical protein